MDRAYLSNTSGSAPTAPASPATGYPQSGNPQTATQATRPGPYWYHMITESIRNVLVAAGLSPAQTDLTLLTQAVTKLASTQTGALKPARAISTTNITLSGAQTIDGVSIVAGDRVLVAGQTTGANNGMYVAAAGAWSRTTDTFVAGILVPVSEGTVNGNTTFRLSTAAPIILGTTSIAFAKDLALKPANNLSDLGSVATALTNLGFAGTSLASPGYIKLPTGVILQWGSFISSTAAVAVTFPVAFPTACRNVLLTPVVQNSAAYASVDQVTLPGTTGFSASNWNGGARQSAVAVFWFALGN